MFKKGDRVFIKEGGWGYDGIITDITDTGGSPPFALVELHEDGKVREVVELLSNLRMYHKIDTYPETQFDFSKYLSEDQMRDISTRIYEEKVTSFVDDILERRTGGGGSIVDQILAATVEKYVNKLSNKFENEFLQRIKDEIVNNDPENENHQSFRQSLVWKLSNTADKYIDEHLPEIHNLMATTVQDAATSLQLSDISTKIARKIDLTKIISELILEHHQV